LLPGKKLDYLHLTEYILALQLAIIRDLPAVNNNLYLSENQHQRLGAGK